jgi:hypothetical protein
MSEIENDSFIEIDKMSIDQAAGAFVMIAGAIGSLLLVIWQSKCHCKMNLCYIFQCERRPPNEEEMKGLKEQSKKLKDINKKKEDKTLQKEDEILDEVEKGTPRLIPEIKIKEPEPQQDSNS